MRQSSHELLQPWAMPWAMSWAIVGGSNGDSRSLEPTPQTRCQRSDGQQVVTIAQQVDGVNLRGAIERSATPLFLAARSGQVELVAALLADADTDVNKAGDNEETSLWIAARFGHESCMAALLGDTRTDVNQPNRYGQTPLWIAARCGHVSCVAALLADDRTDVNRAGKFRLTPLYIAAYWGHEPCVTALLRSGADASIASSVLQRGRRSRDCTSMHNRKTPLNAAREMGQGNCIVSLERVLCATWTLGPRGSLRTMPRWIKERAVTVVLCLRYHGLPPELIDLILPMCAVSARVETIEICPAGQQRTL